MTRSPKNTEGERCQASGSGGGSISFDPFKGAFRSFSYRNPSSLFSSRLDNMQGCLFSQDIHGASLPPSPVYASVLHSIPSGNSVIRQQDHKSTEGKACRTLVSGNHTHEKKRNQ